MTTPMLETFGAGYLRLYELLSASSDAQWQGGRREQPHDDTTERSKGQTSDPTATVVADERRLRLRARVIEAEQALEAAGRAMQKAERNLSDALDAWYND